jgi:Tol biopolymer transport system component
VREASGKVVLLQETGFTESSPSFRGDSQTLAYSRKNRGGEDLFIWEGGRALPRIGGNGDQSRPAWAGSALVFFSNQRGDEHWDVAVSRGTGDKVTLARDVRLPMRAAPALSPDGTWVAYALEDAVKGDSIWLTKVDGSATVEVTTGLEACGEPALIEAGGRMYLAYTALPSEGADWRSLHVVDITSKIP